MVQVERFEGDGAPRFWFRAVGEAAPDEDQSFC